MGESLRPQRVMRSLLLAASLTISLAMSLTTSLVAATSPAPDERLATLFDSLRPAELRLAALAELLADGVRPATLAPLLHDRCEPLVAELLRRADPAEFPAAAERAVELLVAGGGEALKHQALALIRRREASDDGERLFAAALQYEGALRRHARLLVATLPSATRARLLAAALTSTASVPALREAAALARDLAGSSERAELIVAARALAEEGEEAARGIACGAWLALEPGSRAAREMVRGWARAQRDERRFAALEACQVPQPAELGAFLLPLVVERLRDSEWPIRKAAIDAAAALALPAAATALVEAMEQERERSALRRDAARALRRLTGAPLRDDPADWRRHLADHPECVPLSVAAWAELEERLERQARTGTGGEFYELPVRSDRVMVLIDASGSMGADGKLERACAEAAALIDSLPVSARLNVVFFDSGLRQFATSAQPLDAATRERANRFLAAQAPGGGTNLHGALVAALDDPEVDTVYLLSDGAPSAGVLRDPAALRRDIARRNRLKGVVIHAIALDGDRALLAELVADSGGTLR